MISKHKVIQLILAFFILFNLSQTTQAHPNNQNSGTIVVANRASGDLTLIDVATDATTTLAMPAGINQAEPMYAVYKRGKVFVGDRANNRVIVFDRDDWSVIGEVPTGNGIFHMWSQHHGKQLWVNNELDNSITIINTQDLNVITTIDLPTDLINDGGRPHDVILDNRFAYVSIIGLSGNHDALLKYNLHTFQEVARADVGKDPHVTLSPKRKTIYVGGQNTNEIRVLKRRDLSLVAVLSANGAHGFNITRNGRVVYATNISGGGIEGLYTIDTRTNTFIGDPVDTPYAVPHNIVLARPNRKLYLTHSGATSDKVTVYSISKHNPEPVFLTEITTGLNPFGIEFVPARREY